MAGSPGDRVSGVTRKLQIVHGGGGCWGGHGEDMTTGVETGL